jgi:hypothetical protein
MRSAARRKREHLRARQGHVGGGLARRWERADHAMTAVGRDGVDATDADVVVLAVPSGQIADALGKVGGLAGRRWRLRRCSTARRIRAGLSDLVTSVVTGSSWPGQPKQIVDGDAGRAAALLHCAGQRGVLDDPAPPILLQLERRA